MNRNAPRTDPKGNSINNIILASIPDEEFSQLKPHLKQGALEVGRKLPARAVCCGVESDLSDDSQPTFL
jgi:hypothetical protein